MAKLSDLDLINEAGSTYALYTLLRNHYTALQRLSGTVFYYTAAESVEVAAADVVDGGQYFMNAADEDLTVTLPLAANNLGMEVLVSVIHETASASIARTGSDTIQGETSLDLDPGDHVKVKAVAAGVWLVTGRYVAPTA